MNPNNEVPQPVQSTPLTNSEHQSKKGSVLPVFVFGLVFTLIIAGGVAYYLVAQTPQSSNAGSNKYLPYTTPSITPVKSTVDEVNAIDLGSVENDLMDVKKDLNGL